MLWNTDVWTEMERLRRDMNSLFTGYGRAAGSNTFPLVNAYENKEALVLTAELPGLAKDQVDITFADGQLTIAGKAAAPDAVKDMVLIRQERSLGEFEKTLRIPVKIDAEKISAAFTNGVLTITLPKAEEAKPKTIAIEAK